MGKLIILAFIVATAVFGVRHYGPTIADSFKTTPHSTMSPREARATLPECSRTVKRDCWMVDANGEMWVL